ncbi:NACHT domain-containing protein [Amycolatopsis sp. RTGN1]|uniref:NACHT domain-containing protein n=1 Tax=Amycolatopsis ponsaeliensis TaxID=2992142 RepID=UPI002550424B|nr:hypothetical protein [Amycolatopsis sp. RTGN1]
MAQRSLSYADAVRLLGGSDSKILGAFKRVAGLLILGPAPLTSDVLTWFDAKGELVRLSKALVGRAAERQDDLSQFDRMQRLEAAHTIIVVTAFFESLGEVRLPVEVTRSEQLALAGGDLNGIHDFADQIQSVGRVVPNPAQTAGSFRTDLRDYYLGLADRLHQFISGLAAWDQLAATERNRLTRELVETAERAIDRYQESLRRLATDFPEIQVWILYGEHQVNLATLTEREEVPDPLIPGRASDATRQRLASAYRSSLQQPLARPGDFAGSVLFPTVDEAYVSPLFRTAEATHDARINDESWWAEQPIHEALETFLTNHLTSARAARAPLMVLGQPGSGKSLLTKMLAARLPSDSFLPIRVPLRHVSGDFDIEHQVDQALRITTHERISWPELARSAGDVLPVLLLDGFDELLQATGVNHSDYLVRIEQFQHREAAQGRPLAVIVTSRTIVAGQATTPAETIALRLEPFDDSRVGAWLDSWNRTNATEFARRGLSPLALDTVLSYRELATQPLLLLMLALYDADNNALQHHAADLPTHKLYERLVSGFASREVSKLRAGLSGPSLSEATELEIGRLSVAAFAMFNRGTHWVTDSDLDADLRALDIAPESWLAPAGMRKPTAAAQLIFGRFFFVHESQAARHETPVRTYEFLHASFGEYLVSRLSWEVLQAEAARAAAARRSFRRAHVEDHLLRALLSYQPLSSQPTILAFLDGLAGETPANQDSIRSLVLTLFRNANHAPGLDRYAAYQPHVPGEPARCATYSANLLLLSLCIGAVRVSELYQDRSDPVDAWHDQTLLWRSQLSAGGWQSLVDAITLERIRDGEQRDVRLTMGSGPHQPAIDLAWTFGHDPDTRSDHSLRAIGGSADWLRRESYFQCGVHDDLVQHAVEPLTARLLWTVTTFTGVDTERFQSVAHALAEVLADPSPAAYRAAAAIGSHDGPPWTGGENIRFWRLLLDRLGTGAGADPLTAADVLGTLLNQVRDDEIPALADGILRCVLTYLGQDQEADLELARLVGVALAVGLEAADLVLAIDALVRAHELGLPAPIPARLLDSTERARLLDRVNPIRPDLRARLEALIGAGS